MLKREILLTGCAIALALSGQKAMAEETCSATPTCAELGYTEWNCGGFVSLKCPYNQSRMFCSRYKCEDGYYRYAYSRCVELVTEVVYSGSTAIGVAVSSNLVVAMTDESEGKTMTWAEADAACKAKTTGGKKWRLPTYDAEVNGDVGVIKMSRDSLDVHLTTNGGSAIIGSGYHWTSTKKDDEKYHIFAFAGSNVSSTLNISYTIPTSTYPVRCVFDR